MKEVYVVLWKRVNDDWEILDFGAEGDCFETFEEAQKYALQKMVKNSEWSPDYTGPDDPCSRWRLMPDALRYQIVRLFLQEGS